MDLAARFGADGAFLAGATDLVGPHGAKGVGEPPNIEPPATVANALAAATGLRVTSLPITAEKIVLGPGQTPG